MTEVFVEKVITDPKVIKKLMREQLGWKIMRYIEMDRILSERTDRIVGLVNEDFEWCPDIVIRKEAIDIAGTINAMGFECTDRDVLEHWLTREFIRRGAKTRETKDEHHQVPEDTTREGVASAEGRSRSGDDPVL